MGKLTTQYGIVAAEFEDRLSKDPKPKSERRDNSGEVARLKALLAERDATIAAYETRAAEARAKTAARVRASRGKMKGRALTALRGAKEDMECGEIEAGRLKK